LPHFPHNYISFVEELCAKAAINVLGIAEVDSDQLPPNLKRFSNLESKNGEAYLWNNLFECYYKGGFLISRIFT